MPATSREVLEALLAGGADPSGPHSHWGNTPLYFLAGYHRFDDKRHAATSGIRRGETSAARALLDAEPALRARLSTENRWAGLPLHHAAWVGGQAAESMASAAVRAALEGFWDRR